jgi:hypothetical protein
MHCEKQMRIIESIPFQSVVLHVDSTGKLTKWPTEPVKYKQLMNYAIVLKDLRCASKPGIIVNEAITSEQNTYIVFAPCHTMNRFVENVKKNVDFSTFAERRLAICSFTLLLNCRSLSCFESIYYLMLKIYLNKF